TAVPARFCTMARPKRSTIGPRLASTRRVRSWLFSAAWRYCVPERTCRAQRRKKRTPKAASTRKPRIPMRNTIWAVRRYGASTRGSGGRKRPGLGGIGRLAKLDLVRAPRLRRCEQTAAECEDRDGEQQVEHDLGRECIDEGDARRG